jgi:hypothetical protein
MGAPIFFSNMVHGMVRKTTFCAGVFLNLKFALATLIPEQIFEYLA